MARVEGVAEASRAYSSIATDARDERPANAAIVDAATRAARAAAPHRTGALAASIGGEASDRAATLTVGVPYWPYQEFGTRFMRGRRFMAAGIRAGVDAAPEAYRRQLETIAKRRT